MLMRVSVLAAAMIAILYRASIVFFGDTSSFQKMNALQIMWLLSNVIGSVVQVGYHMRYLLHISRNNVSFLVSICV